MSLEKRKVLKPAKKGSIDPKLVRIAVKKASEDRKNKMGGMSDKYKALRAKFKEGDWVFGIGNEVGCSPVFDHDKPNIQPFSYLGATNPDDFRLATEQEIEESKAML